MQTKEIICPTCGGRFEENAKACPFCGTMYLPGAQEAYRQRLADMQEDLEDLSDAGSEHARVAAGHVSKKILRTVLISLIVLAAIILFAVIAARRDRQDVRAEYEWQQTHFPEMETLYENGEYDALVDMYRTAVEEGHDSVYDWEHAAFCRSAEYVRYLDDAFATSKEPLSEEDLTWILYCELKLDGALSGRQLSAGERNALQDMAAAYIEDMKNRFDVEDPAFKALQSAVAKDGYVDYDECESFIKNQKERGK